MSGPRSRDGPGAGEQKRRLRDRVWTRLEGSDAERFPGARGRIPNFRGAEEAAERLRDTDAWIRADVVKANPDAPQWPVRQRALEDGKLVYMAVPKLTAENPFFVLDPSSLEESPRKASSISGAGRNARTVPMEQLDPVDLVVTGCVAASTDGRRLGKGGGYSDLEFALGLETGLLDREVPIATTVHPLQVVSAGEIPMTAHDISLDLLATPDRVRATEDRPSRPEGIRWEELGEEKIESIPLLRELRP